VLFIEKDDSTNQWIPKIQTVYHQQLSKGAQPNSTRAKTKLCFHNTIQSINIQLFIGLQ